MKICPFPICQLCYEDKDSSCVHEGHPALIHARTGGRVIDGRYRIDQLLGRGGMGAVYKCTHVGLNQPRAIKLLLPDSAGSDPNRRLRLRREALTACRFDHPNVVRIYDSGTNVISIEEEGTTESYDELYIVMELLEGQTLKTYLKSNRPIPLKQAVSIAIQIADGLAEVHAQRVIYRDLKPANVMITRDRHGNLLVKIVDFGAVKLMDQPQGLRDVDITGAMFIGSAPYASPENCKNEPLDERSDIYNLGLILYEMLAGHPPFETSDWAELLNKHAHAPAPPLTGVPKPLARLVAQALEKDPNARPQSAAEFASVLRDFERSVELHSETTSKATPLSVSSVTTRPHSGLNHGEEDPSDGEETRVAVAVAAQSKEPDVSAEANEAAPAKHEGSGVTLIEGSVVHGTVLRLTADGAVIDLGSVTEGLVTWEDLVGNAEGKAIPLVEPGQEIKATVTVSREADGFTHLSLPKTPVAAAATTAGVREKSKPKPQKAVAKAARQSKPMHEAAARTAVAAIIIAVSLSASTFLIWRLGHKPLPTAGAAETPNTSVAPPTAPKFNSEVGDEAFTTTDVNIRLRPGGKAPLVGLAEKGSRVRVLEKHNNWRKITVLDHGREKEDLNSEDQGWIDGDNLRAVDDGI